MARQLSRHQSINWIHASRRIYAKRHIGVRVWPRSGSITVSRLTHSCWILYPIPRGTRACNSSLFCYMECVAAKGLSPHVAQLINTLTLGAAAIDPGRARAPIVDPECHALTSPAHIALHIVYSAKCLILLGQGVTERIGSGGGRVSPTTPSALGVA